MIFNFLFFIAWRFHFESEKKIGIFEYGVNTKSKYSRLLFAKARVYILRNVIKNKNEIFALKTPKLFAPVTVYLRDQ